MCSARKGGEDDFYGMMARWLTVAWAIITWRKRRERSYIAA
jgi:hypothetical protein